MNSFIYFLLILRQETMKYVFLLFKFGASIFFKCEPTYFDRTVRNQYKLHGLLMCVVYAVRLILTVGIVKRLKKKLRQNQRTSSGLQILF